jgi:hypothetical protein
MTPYFYLLHNQENYYRKKNLVYNYIFLVDLNKRRKKNPVHSTID